MLSDDIRALYLRYFEERGHTVLPSSSLVPQGDPTLLLTNAGMVQIKPFFMGEATPPNVRLTSCQKCFRTTDIDEVGDDTHLTFFEMLGNFSVADYFKEEAIAYAWEFVTEYLKMPPERLWFSVFEDDDEAFGYWRRIGIPAERIARLGEEHNFWGPAGASGPCGPDSEIFYDRGAEYGCGRDSCGPGCDCERFVELWNLVFIQYDQDADGARSSLPGKNIDTGMGLERMAMILQGVDSVYDTDVFRPIRDRVCDLAGVRYGEDAEADRAVRVVTEHARSVAFLASDDIIPGNEGRGYVARRVLRRAVLFGRRLGLEGPFLAPVVEAVISRMEKVYPALREKQDFIQRVVALEEERFGETLSAGLALLEDVISQHEQRGEKTLSGEEVFRLYDTHGFPNELTAEIAAEHGLEIDLEGFEREMERQRETARAAAGTAAEEGAGVYASLSVGSTTFVGYEAMQHTSPVVALLVNGKPVESVSAGQAVEVVLQETPFYAEMGGQVGDRGEIVGPRGRVAVADTQHPLPELTVHHGRVSEGSVSVGEVVEAAVDRQRRADIKRNHTATHLLQAALRSVLGSHVHQAGSLVAADRLRFDFSHLERLTAEELERVESLVNAMIREDLPVKTRFLSYTEALERGAIALFDEKYGDTVRVVEVSGDDGEPVSLELCGGTHVSATGEIGICHITQETGIGAGMRRIEAVTGRGAEAFYREKLAALEEVAGRLQTTPANLVSRVEGLLRELEAQRRRISALEREVASGASDELLAQVQQVDGVPLLVAEVAANDMDGLRRMGDRLRNRMKSGVIVLGAAFNDKPNFVVMVTPDLVERGYHAGRLAQRVSALAGGGGGGRPQMGQGGGRETREMEQALAQVPGLLRD